jgi:hypothetical protein
MQLSPDRLTRTGGARDQQMRHRRQIGDHGIARDVLAEDDRQLGLLVLERLTEPFRARHRLALAHWAVRCRSRAPGTVATRADSADMLRAISSASWTTRLALIPAAGSSSYMVTTGPGRTSTIAPLTWKSSSTDSSSRALRSSPALSISRVAPS